MLVKINGKWVDTKVAEEVLAIQRIGVNPNAKETEDPKDA